MNNILASVFKYWYSSDILTETDNMLVTPTSRFSGFYCYFAREHKLNANHLSESSEWFPPTRKVRTLLLPPLLPPLWPPGDKLQQQHWETSKKQRQEELAELWDKIRWGTSSKISLCFWWHLQRMRLPKGLHAILMNPKVSSPSVLLKM